METPFVKYDVAFTSDTGQYHGFTAIVCICDL